MHRHGWLALLFATATGCTLSVGLDAGPIDGVEVYVDRDTIDVGDTVRVLAQGFHGDYSIWVEPVRAADWSVTPTGIVAVEDKIISGSASSVRLRGLRVGKVTIRAILNDVQGSASLVVVTRAPS